MSFLTVTDDPRRWSVTMCLEKLYVLIFSFRFMFPTCRIVYFYNCFSSGLNMWLKYPNLKLSVSRYSRHVPVKFFLIKNILQFLYCCCLVLHLKVEGKGLHVDFMNLDVWVDGWVTSPRIGSMDSVQIGKAVFVEESYTTLGIEPRTFSNPGRSGNHSGVHLG